MEEYVGLPSLTLVNGPFGDFVQYTRDTGMYFSFHPVSCLGLTVDETEMMKWAEIAEGHISADLARCQIEAHQKAFEMLFPGYSGSFKCPRLHGGYILGNGFTNITDAKSKLHELADEPFLLQDGYVTVSTQQLTSAPYSAYLLEQRLFFDQTY